VKNLTGIVHGANENYPSAYTSTIRISAPLHNARASPRTVFASFADAKRGNLGLWGGGNQPSKITPLVPRLPLMPARSLVIAVPPTLPLDSA